MRIFEKENIIAICLRMILAPRCPVNWKAGALLGSGAFGEVYVCHDKDTGRDLAMKVVRLEQMNAETSKVHL